MKKEAPDWFGCGRKITTESWNGFLKAQKDYWEKKDAMNYKEAKTQIKKVGYANVTGDAALLSYCECLNTYFQFQAMSNGKWAKKIYLWARAHNVDVFQLLKWVRTDGNQWLAWNAILDNKPIQAAATLPTSD